MIRNTLIASLIAFGVAGAAQAQDGGPRLVGGGPDAQDVYAEPSQNVVGGGRATIIGGNTDQRLAYGGATRIQPQSGLVAEIVGGGENQRVVYHQAGPAASMVAGRPARPGS